MPKKKTRTCARLLHFVDVWSAMSADGHCDALGSAEFERCIIEFCEQNLPNDVRLFIQQAANRPPSYEAERQGK
jgi:hypothetical protein